MRIFIALTCLAAALSFAGAPASAQQAPPARPNILENDPACEGYTTANYREIYNANAAG